MPNLSLEKLVTCGVIRSFNLARFGNYVVLQGHGVLPLAGDFFQACFPAESFHAES